MKPLAADWLSHFLTCSYIKANVELLLLILIIDTGLKFCVDYSVIKKIMSFRKVFFRQFEICFNKIK